MRQSFYEFCCVNGKQQLLDEWDDARNLPLTPQTVTYGSRIAAWWRCRYGHSWSAAIYTRTEGAACPYCAGRRVLPGFNDLASQAPTVAAEWDAEKNGRLTPQSVTPTSNRKVWWRCEKGHSYQAVIASRTTGSGCPYCAGRRVLPGFNDLATLEPRVAAEWHPTLNGTLTPQMVTAGSRKKVWWQGQCGHVWCAVIFSRAGKQHCGCPVCSGNVRSRKPR